MERKSSGPFRPCRRLRASRTASLRDRGTRALRRATSSSRVACMTSMSSGRGLRNDLARASLPRSATSRRRISFSISARSWSMRAWNSSRSSRSSRAVSVTGGAAGRRVVVEGTGRGPGLGHQALQHAVEVEVPQRPVEVVGPTHRPARLHAGVPAHRLAGHRGHHGAVGPEQGLVQQVGQLLGGHPLARRHRPGHGPGPAGGPGRASGRRHRWAAGPTSSWSSSIWYSGPAEREVDLEGRLVGPPVRRRLHQAGPEGVLDGLTVLHGHVA